MAYIELLEIDENAGVQQISERLSDRYQYFSTLVSTAPTMQLRAIYQRKLSDLQILANHYSIKISASGADQTPKDASTKSSKGTEKAGQQQALLVLHTEGRALRSYPLLPGINILGRSQGTSGNTILIDDDYMSRAHAVVEITSIKEKSALLYDIGELPGCKSSTNGVFLNGNEQRLSGKVALNPNDTLQVGYAKLVLTYSAAAERGATMFAIGKKEYSNTVFIKVN